MKPKLKLPGTTRLKLKCDVLLSASAFKFSLRRYNEGSTWWDVEAGVTAAIGPGEGGALLAALPASAAAAAASGYVVPAPGSMFPAAHRANALSTDLVAGTGLHSFTFQLNLSRV
jgi:hypothetical protein